MLGIGLDEAFDQVYLLQGHLHRVLVLGSTRGIGHPQLQVEKESLPAILLYRLLAIKMQC